MQITSPCPAEVRHGQSEVWDHGSAFPWCVNATLPATARQTLSGQGEDLWKLRSSEKRLGVSDGLKRPNRSEPLPTAKSRLGSESPIQPFEQARPGCGRRISPQAQFDRSRLKSAASQSQCYVRQAQKTGRRCQVGGPGRPQRCNQGKRAQEQDKRQKQGKYQVSAILDAHYGSICCLYSSGSSSSRSPVKLRFGAHLERSLFPSL